MKKYCCLLSIFIVMLIASCSSLHIGGYSERDKEEALLYLGNDMISLIEEDDSIDPSVFISGLPPEYTVYSSYSPIYDDTAGEYAERLSEIISPLLPALYQLAETYLDEAVSADRDASIAEAEGLTDKLQNLIARDAYNLLLEGIEARRDEIERAFVTSYETFSSIKAAYDNLSGVGFDTDLPEPVSYTTDSLGFLVTEYFFTRMGEAERYFKSQLPEEADPIYRIFWEETL